MTSSAHKFQTQSGRKVVLWVLVVALALLLALSAGTSLSAAQDGPGGQGATAQSPISHFPNSQPRTLTYAYDAAGRLVSANYGGGVGLVYSYDAAGNLIRQETLMAPAVTFSGGTGGPDVTLSWTHDPLYVGYQAWYSTQPYFVPGDDCQAPPASMSCAYVEAPDPTFTHAGAAANIINNYAYLVLGVTAGGTRSSNSNRVAEFGFGLIPGTP